MSVFLSLSLFGQTEGNIVRMDPALDAIVPATAKVEKVAGGFGFIEGPVWAKQGYLLFSDIPRSKIYKVTAKGDTSIFMSQTGKANGLTFDKQERLYMCEHENRQISRLEKDGKKTVIVANYQGKRLNSPNDLVLHSSGAVYFTDPPYGLPKGDDDPAKDLSFNGLLRSHNGKTQLLDSTLIRPNGLAFSPDEKYLYVSDNDGKRQIWFQYEVKKGGSVANKKTLFEAPTQPNRTNVDGLKVDVKGNLYCTGLGGIAIFSPQGKQLGLIEAPELPANCAWGDADGKTLYLTARTGLYKIRLNTEGVRPK
jgi:gluconolactonase